MNPLTKPITLIMALLIMGSAFSQIRDTIVVYEYIHVTDTVWVEPEVPEMLPLNEAIIVNHSKKICVQLEKSATNYNSCIINKENDNETKMKRTTFFTMLLLTFQTATYGQSAWSIYAGGSTMLLPHGLKTIDNPLWSGLNVGIERKWKLGESNFSFNTGLGAKYLLPPNVYAELDVDQIARSEFERDYSDIYTWHVLLELNTGTFIRPCFQFSVPLMLSLPIGRFEPHIGVVYSLSNFYNIESSSNMSNQSAHVSNVELSGGSKFWISKKWATSVCFRKAMIGIPNRHNDISLASLGTNDFYFKPIYFDLGIHYAF